MRPYLHLSPLVADIEGSLQTFVDTFRRDWDMDARERDVVIREQMLGNELRLAIDGRGKMCVFDDCPPDGWRGIVDYAEVDGEFGGQGCLARDAG